MKGIGQGKKEEVGGIEGPGSGPDNIQHRVLDGVDLDASWGKPSLPNGIITVATTIHSLSCLEMELGDV